MKSVFVVVAASIFCLSGGLAAQQNNPAPSSAPDNVLAVSPTSQEQPVIPVPTPQQEIAVSAANTEPSPYNGARPGDSHVRIVRLSQAIGHIGLDRGNGNVEATMQNMPIVENSRLATGKDGYAEVEFEDGSTLRIAPDSQVNFPRLILRSTGAKATTVQLIKGMMYVNLQRTKDTEFTVETGNTVMTVNPATHMRLSLENSKATLTVFNGNVAMQNGAVTTAVEKKRSVTFDPVTPPQTFEVAKKVEEIPYDEWDKKAIDYHDHYMNTKAFGSSLYSYGISDLNYYGSFSNIGGCGSMWRPYFVDATWSPYSNGVWAWYQGAGYSWVSPYPWGWMPYHSGSWAYCSGAGWGWRPGSAWWGLANINPGIISRPVVDKPGAPTRGVARGGLPVAPPGPERPTATPRNTLVLSNHTPLIYSRMDRPDNFVFQKNSAGLGVPRGSLGNLHGFSSHVERNGFVNHEVYVQPSAGFRSSGGVMRPGGPATIHSASPAWARGNSEAWQGQAGSFSGNRAGNLSSGSTMHGGNSGASASPAAGSFHGGGGGSMGSGGGGGGGGSHGGGGSMGGGASPGTGHR
ncbi:MAG TPA: FecR family protein [Edaphobacter sp.]|nr:FecR family protein [Edaphobacter sp.]